MNGNIELLNYIYQNSQMGIIAIEQLTEIAPDSAKTLQVESQLEDYKAINQEAVRFFKDFGYDEKGIGAFEKMKTNFMINMQTLTDKTPSHIAEMMIIGSNMGVIEAIKTIKKYKDADKKILSLMKKLQSMEENNIDLLKSYL